MYIMRQTVWYEYIEKYTTHNYTILNLMHCTEHIVIVSVHHNLLHIKLLIPWCLLKILSGLVRNAESVDCVISVPDSLSKGGGVSGKLPCWKHYGLQLAWGFHKCQLEGVWRLSRKCSRNNGFTITPLLPTKPSWSTTMQLSSIQPIRFMPLKFHRLKLLCMQLY